MPKFYEDFAVRLPDGTRDVQVFDEDLPEFGIRKFANGRASCFVKYGIGAQQRDAGQGSSRQPQSNEARSIEVLATRLGTDPAAVKCAATAKIIVTLGVLTSRYLDDRQPTWRPRYYAEMRRQLERDWKPLHGLEVGAIARQAILVVRDDIASAQGEVAADRARSALSELCGWGIDRGYCDSKPTLGIRPRDSRRARRRVLTKRELVEVWQAAGDGEYGTTVKLLILTGQRRLEIGDLGWSEIDLEKRQIELPAKRTKADRPHIIPLSEAVVAIIRAIRQQEGRDFVFGERAGGFSGWSKAKVEPDGWIASARKKAGVEDRMPPWRLHDLRRRFVTHVNESGIAHPHVEAIINHISGHLAGVAGVYDKGLYLAERSQALERWGAHVAALVAGSRSHILPLKRTLQQHTGQLR